MYHFHETGHVSDTDKVSILAVENSYIKTKVLELLQILSQPSSREDTDNISVARLAFHYLLAIFFYSCARYCAMVLSCFKNLKTNLQQTRETKNHSIVIARGISFSKESLTIISFALLICNDDQIEK